MEVRDRASAKIVDFRAYRAERLQRTLWDDSSSSTLQDHHWQPERAASSLSDRQLAHRKRMLAFLLMPR